MNPNNATPSIINPIDLKKKLIQEKFLNKYKEALTKRISITDSELAKSQYKFIIDNFENYESVLKYDNVSPAIKKYFKDIYEAYLRDIDLEYLKGSITVPIKISETEDANKLNDDLKKKLIQEKVLKQYKMVLTNKINKTDDKIKKNEMYKSEYILIRDNFEDIENVLEKANISDGAKKYFFTIYKMYLKEIQIK